MKEYICKNCYDATIDANGPCILKVPLDADYPGFCPYDSNCIPHWRRVDKYDD